MPASTGFFERLKARGPTPREAARLGDAADAALRKGNAVRAAILRGTAAVGDPPERELARRAAMRADLDTLGARLDAALRAIAAEDGKPRRPTESAMDLLPFEATDLNTTWTPTLMCLVEQAVARRSLRYPIEARLLYDLQRAAAEHEKTPRAVDLVAWALSRGKIPVVRALPATRELRVARALRDAAAKVRHVHIASAERKILAKTLAFATERADQNVRAALRPRLLRALTVVGLRPENVPERVARDKLVEELLDHAVLRGHLSLAHLRDALSRNQLKLEDLKGPREFFGADALLETDRLLGRGLDGVYRRGEVYMRLLQKASSLAFGTHPGRVVTMYILLPLGGAFMALAAISHILSAHILGLGEIDLVTTTSLAITTIALFGFLHSESLRRAGRRALRILGVVLSALLLRAPRWLFSRASVQRFIRQPIVRATARRLIIPLIATWLTYRLSPLSTGTTITAVYVCLAVFVALSALMNTSVALFIEDALLDWIAPTWRSLTDRVLPGLLRLVTGTFGALMDLVERTIYRVDEWLRFREGDWRGLIVPKAIIGIAWFVVAYIIRLYVTLFIEPELNPVKHFPVITVAHKLLLPFAGDIMNALTTVFSPIALIVGNPIVATAAVLTAFLVPSASGFLAWELKENWKLYRENRPDILRPTVVGSHGETMTAIMVPGFHSGTLPKLFEKRRRAAQRDDERSREERTLNRSRATAEGSLGSFREGMGDLEIAIRRFVDRELLGLLRRARRWTVGPILVKNVALAPNRVRVDLVCPEVSAGVCTLLVEEQSGLLVASIPTAGFLSKLDRDGDAARLFENALAGFYHLAAIDLVREPIEAAIGKGTPYDVADEGLVVWPGPGYRTEAIYSLRPRATADPMIEPVIRGEPAKQPLRPLDEREIVFRHHPIAWAAWVAAWGAADRSEGRIPRLLRGASILPRG
jgi:hypothetical protein